MKNKAHLVNQLRVLRNWTDLDSQEVQDLYKLTILELLLAIRTERSQIKEPDESMSLVEVLGCYRD